MYRKVEFRLAAFRPVGFLDNGQLAKSTLPVRNACRSSIRIVQNNLYRFRILHDIGGVRLSSQQSVNEAADQRFGIIINISIFISFYDFVSTVLHEMYILITSGCGNLSHLSQILCIFRTVFRFNGHILAGLRVPDTIVEGSYVIQRLSVVIEKLLGHGQITVTADILCGIRKSVHCHAVLFQSYGHYMVLTRQRVIQSGNLIITQDLHSLVAVSRDQDILCLTAVSTVGTACYGYRSHLDIALADLVRRSDRPVRVSQLVYSKLRQVLL